MSIITARNGDQLVEFCLSKNLAVTAQRYTNPLTFACVVASYERKVLFVYNPWRKEWELPAGGIHPGETPETAALRELYEESGQTPQKITFVGICLLHLKHRDKDELGAMYTCEIETIQPFIPNDEASDLLLWDMVSPVEGHVNIMGKKLAEIAMAV